MLIAVPPVSGWTYLKKNLCTVTKCICGTSNNGELLYHCRSDSKNQLVLLENQVGVLTTLGKHPKVLRHCSGAAHKMDVCGRCSAVRCMSSSLLREMADYIMGLGAPGSPLSRRRRRLFFTTALRVGSGSYAAHEEPSLATLCVSPIGSVCESPRVLEGAHEAMGQLDDVGDVVLLRVTQATHSVVYRDEIGSVRKALQEPRKKRTRVRASHNRGGEAPREPPELARGGRSGCEWRFRVDAGNYVICNCNERWVVIVVSGTLWGNEHFMHIWKVVDTVPQEPHEILPLATRFGEAPSQFQFSSYDSTIPAGDEISILSCTRWVPSAMKITLYIINLAKPFNEKNEVLATPIIVCLRPIGTRVTYPGAVSWHQGGCVFLPVTTEDATHTLATKLYRIVSPKSASVSSYPLPTASWIRAASNSRFILRDATNEAMYHICDIDHPESIQTQIITVEPGWSASFHDYFALITNPGPTPLTSTVKLLDTEKTKHKHLVTITLTHPPGSHPTVTFNPRTSL
ncbi:hypothetical protein Pelo_3438 [Pelomyxa schiedti]|nr:hypothetical protein Pelo_3438 [Pelomyxa schiedti]